MIYTILKALVWIAVRVYFRKIHFTKEGLIPAQGPVLLVGNHPNSFLDAVVLAVLMKRSLHFLARSDVFDKPWKQWILSKLHMIPIYRLQEGKENLSKNEATFERCKALFEAGEVVLIFPEGLSIPEKRLRKLKKGAAKIAFQSEAAHDFGLGIQVVCAGINYSHPLLARKTLMIEFSEPFPMLDFKEEYNAQPAQAIHSLNKVIEQKIREKTIIIAQPSQESLAENLLTLGRNQASKTSTSLQLEQDLCHLAQEIDPELEQEIQQYFEKLAENKLTDSAISAASKVSYGKIWLSYLGFPVYALGILLYLHFISLAHMIAEKTTKNTQFYTSVHFALHFGVILLVYTLLLLVILINFGIVHALLSLSVAGVLGLFTLHFHEWKQNIAQRRHLARLKHRKPSLIQSLKAKRAKISQAVFSELVKE